MQVDEVVIRLHRLAVAAGQQAEQPEIGPGPRLAAPRAQHLLAHQPGHFLHFRSQLAQPGSAVLAVGGRIEVILPAADYREQKVDPADAPHFDALLRQASDVRTMPFATAGPVAYRAAGEAVLDAVERLVAVWDGVPGGRLGGTGDLVGSARERGLPVTVVWPDGAQRG